MKIEIRLTNIAWSQAIDIYFSAIYVINHLSLVVVVQFGKVKAHALMFVLMLYDVYVQGYYILILYLFE